MHIRQPCVAGHFYPADPHELAITVQGLLQNAKVSHLSVPKAIIAPHAGYVYSGPIAASIYKTLAPHQKTIKRVLLLGPAHRVAFTGIAVTDYDYFATPLGNIKIERSAVAQACTLPHVKINEHAYDNEHSLEVHLPFLQQVLDDFSLIPCVVGSTSPQVVADLIINLWGGDETLIVISSDLSHYHNYTTANTLDKATTAAIMQLKPDDISEQQACGRTPIKGLLLAAKGKQLAVTTLDLRNSGDTAGNKDRVVGYGAYHFV